MNCNTGVYVARNIGALFASARILVFVEDDCIPYPDLISAHIEAYERFDCLSVRGVYEAKTDNPLNALAAHYDLGDTPFPQYVVAEGNASYRSDAFYAVGGWDDRIRFGGGGTDLALRLLQVEPDMRRQIYYPKARIRHDYAVDQTHLERKRDLQSQSFIRLQDKHGEYRMPRWIYRKYFPAAFSDQTMGRQPLVSAPRRVAATKDAVGEYPISLIAIDRARRPLSEWIDSIAKLRRRDDWDVVIVTAAECLMRTLPAWIHIVASAAGGERDAFANAVKQARGNVVLLVDTETRLTADTIDSHVALYTKYDVISVQGLVNQTDGGVLHGFESHPSCEFPMVAHVPINVSYQKNALVRAIDCVCHEEKSAGAPIHLQLLAVEPDFRKQIYSPRPVAIWDAPPSDNQHTRMGPRFDRPRDLRDIELISHSFFGVGGIIPRHDCDRERRAARAIQRFKDEHGFNAAVLRFKEAIALFPEVVYAHFTLRCWSILDLKNILEDLRKGGTAIRDIQTLFERYKRKDLPWFTSYPTDHFSCEKNVGARCVKRAWLCLLWRR